MAGDAFHYSTNIEASKYDKGDKIDRKSIDISYLIIGLCTVLIYLVAGRELNTIDQTIVPRGDAFSYTTFLYQILNKSHTHSPQPSAILSSLEILSGSSIFLCWHFPPSCPINAARLFSSTTSASL